MGLPGAGKTTVADRLAAEHRRIAIPGGRRLADLAHARNDQSLLDDLKRRRPVPPPLFLDLVEEAAPSLRDHDLAFDGFPRNLEHLSIVDRLCQILMTPAGPRTAAFVLL